MSSHLPPRRGLQPVRERHESSNADDEPLCANRSLEDRPRLGAVGPFDGFVASDGFGSFSLFTTPNQNHVPRLAVAVGEITTFDDGRWGAHEYSRWPQSYHRHFVHLACIPRHGSVYDPGFPVLWHDWLHGDWIKDQYGPSRLGRLREDLIKELRHTVDNIITWSEPCKRGPPDVQQKHRFLTLGVRLCFDRLCVLPSERGIIVSLASHVQRLCLELAGLRAYVREVLPRISEGRDCRTDVLDVLGAYTADPSVAQELHRAGVPVWLQQHRRPDIAIWEVVPLTPPPASLSSTPSFPKLVLAQRDLSGFLNTPGRWLAAMYTKVNAELIGSRVPLLVSDNHDDNEECARKKVRELDSEASSSTGVRTRSGTTAQSLAQGLAPVAARPAKKPSRPKAPIESTGSFNVNPFRRFYPSKTVIHEEAWIDALRRVGELKQPSKSASYFFPPPWMFDNLDGFPLSEEKRSRRTLQLVAIRTFCRVRLFDRTSCGGPLNVQQWQEALWGDYSAGVSSSQVAPLIGPSTSSMRAPISSTPATDGKPSKRKQPTKVAREANRLAAQQAIRQVFARADFRNFAPDAAHSYGARVVTLDDVTRDQDLIRSLVWEAHEMNWRCEVLALDAELAGSRRWSDLDQWARESLVSEVWGSASSGMDICPLGDVDRSSSCWVRPPDARWESGRPRLRALLELQRRWPGRPASLSGAASEVDECDAFRFANIQAAAIEFYVDSFVRTYQRLPIPPVRIPHVVATVVTGS